MTHPNEERPKSIVAGVLSFLVPGLGQIYQGRIGKGLLFFVCLLTLFHVGEWMGNWQNVYLPPTGGEFAQDRGKSDLPRSLILRWHYPGQFWIGIAAWPALWQFYDMPTPDPEKYPFLSRYQRAPREDDVNRFLVNSGKNPDLGLMYTVIAGVLNILVIYDAYAGPAFPSNRKKRPESSPDSSDATPEGAAT